MTETGADQHTPTAEDVANSPTPPVLVLPSHTADYKLPTRLENAHSRALPVNTGEAIPVKSELFEGIVKLYIRGIENSTETIFNNGQQRRSIVAIQGRFLKDDISFDDIITGQEFDRVKNMPPHWLVNHVLRRLAAIVSPALDIGPNLNSPSALYPVISGAAGIHVSIPGTEPSLDYNVHEDMSLTDPDLVGVSSDRRKRHFSSKSCRLGRVFDPSYVYTIHLVQHVVDMSRYELHVLRRWNLTRYLDGQPMQLMMKERNKLNKYLFSFAVWHHCLLPSSST